MANKVGGTDKVSKTNQKKMAAGFVQGGAQNKEDYLSEKRQFGGVKRKK